MSRNRTYARDDGSSRGESSGRERFWTRRDRSTREGGGGGDMGNSWRRQNRSMSRSQNDARDGSTHRFWTRRDGSSREGDGGRDMGNSWRRQDRSMNRSQNDARDGSSSRSSSRRRNTTSSKESEGWNTVPSRRGRGQSIFFSTFQEFSKNPKPSTLEHNSPTDFFKENIFFFSLWGCGGVVEGLEKKRNIESIVKVLLNDIISCVEWITFNIVRNKCLWRFRRTFRRTFRERFEKRFFFEKVWGYRVERISPRC